MSDRSPQLPQPIPAQALALKSSPLAARIGADLAVSHVRMGIVMSFSQLREPAMKALAALPKAYEPIIYPCWDAPMLDIRAGRLDVLVVDHLSALVSEYWTRVPIVLIDVEGVGRSLERASIDRRSAGVLTLPWRAPLEHVCDPLPHLVEVAVELGRARAPRPGPRTVLWAEDEETLLYLVADMCERAGDVRLLGARDGRHALEMFEAHRDEIDLIVSDFHMPRMDGPEFFRHIAPEVAGRIPLVCELTGHQEDRWSQSLSPEALPCVHAMQPLGDMFPDGLDSLFDRCFRIKDAMDAARRRRASS